MHNSTHRSSSFAGRNAPSLSLTTTARALVSVPAHCHKKVDDAQYLESHEPTPSLMSANTNFHRRGLAAVTLGDAYLHRMCHNARC
jgi:hypothetical protein